MPKSQGTIERRYEPDITRQVETLRRLIENRAPAEAIPAPEPTAASDRPVHQPAEQQGSGEGSANDV